MNCTIIAQKTNQDKISKFDPNVKQSRRLYLYMYIYVLV